MLKGVDVSSNQPRDICSKLNMDFAIVKATGNPNYNNFSWTYKNPYMEQQADDTLRRGKCLGLYHFAYGVDAVKEADHFIDKARAYIGQALLVLDYEAPLSNKNNREWCRAFLKRLKERTNSTPALYASSSVIRNQNLEALCKEEGAILWSANYWQGNKVLNDYDYSGCKMDIASSKIWQFTENGKVSGYSGLDCDLFYGDANEWRMYASGSIAGGSVSVSKLALDGAWGSDTTRALQRLFGLEEDGMIAAQRPQYFNAVNRGGLLLNSWRVSYSSYSKTIKALQRHIGFKNEDGQFGVYTCKALQKYLGLEEDGHIGKPSQTITEMQKRLNDGAF